MFCLYPSEKGKSFTFIILLRNGCATSVIACFSEANNSLNPPAQAHRCGCVYAHSQAKNAGN